MSSILRALKKLENNPSHLGETQPLDTKFVPLADTSQHQKTTGIILMIIGGGVVCGLVILAGMWLFAEKSQPPPAARQQASRLEVQKAESAPDAVRQPEKTQNKPVTGEPVKALADITAPAKTAAEIPASTSVKIAQPSVAPVAQREAISTKQQAPALTSQPLETSRPDIMKQAPAASVAAVAREPQVTPQAEEKDIPVLHDTDIKLQAITWSKDPKKRIAVINNRILRQGETVSGYRIETINPDDVVFADGREKWKIMFRIK